VEKEQLDKIDVSRHLLPDPASEVVGELVEELRKSNTKISDFIHDFKTIEVLCHYDMSHVFHTENRERIDNIARKAQGKDPHPMYPKS